MASQGNSIHFTIGDKAASEVVVRAVAFVTGCDPLHLEPLGRFVDPDALDALADSSSDVTVSFTYDGVEVEVSGTGDVIVTDPDAATAHSDSIDGASTVLVRGNGDDREACTGLLSRDTSDRTAIQHVLVSRTIDDPSISWDPMASAAARTGIVSVGESTRTSAAASTAVDEPAEPSPIEVVPDPGDLAALERTITGQWALWADGDGGLVICLDSVTGLLHHAPPDRVREFLESLSARVRDADATAHFHIDETAHDERTIAMISEVVDHVLAVDDRGAWTVSE